MKFHQLPLPLKKILPTPLALTLNHYLSLVTALKQCFAVRGALMQVKYLNYHHSRVVFGVFAMKLKRQHIPFSHFYLSINQIS